jgi:vacuolar protein sorting-associated protein VTA1
MARLLELPPIPADLKPILPFLQRADELKFQDPVMSYWSAYAAAHNGIALKSKDPASRNFLATLLATLEKMKEAIGPNDAIDVESASSAYVENFALHIFQRADEEDRRGEAKKSTATKFLASATFLKILKVFPESPGSDAVCPLCSQTIRFAKLTDTQ